MNNNRVCFPMRALGISLVLAGAGWVAAQTSSPAPPQAPTPPPTAIPSREQLETGFREQLRNSTLSGVWQMTGAGGLRGNEELTAPKPDKYTIGEVTKVNDEYWLIHARIEYADKDVNLPVPVRVVWAEDTAIITLNDLMLPLLGTYSARVMIHHGFYSGVWYSNAKNYGGVMQGRLLKTPPAPPPTPTDKPK